MWLHLYWTDGRSVSIRVKYYYWHVQLGHLTNHQPYSRDSTITITSKILSTKLHYTDQIVRNVRLSFSPTTWKGRMAWSLFSSYFQPTIMPVYSGPPHCPGGHLEMPMKLVDSLSSLSHSHYYSVTALFRASHLISSILNFFVFTDFVLSLHYILK